MATASAALIGLLFVAVTVDPERVRHQAQSDRQLNAAMAFFAFVDPLLIALSGLLPDGGAAGTARVVGLVGLLVTLGVARVVWTRRRSPAPARISLPLLVLTGAAYAAQLATAQALLQSPGRAGATNELSAALIVLLTVGILRSWELLGMGQGTFLFGRRPAEAAPPGAGEANRDGPAAAPDGEGA